MFLFFSARHFELVRAAVRRGRERPRGLVFGPRVSGDHVQHVQEGQRKRKDRRMVPYRTKIAPGKTAISIIFCP